jgi:hypothetical protein
MNKRKIKKVNKTFIKKMLKHPNICMVGKCKFTIRIKNQIIDLELNRRNQ